MALNGFPLPQRPVDSGFGPPHPPMGSGVMPRPVDQGFGPGGHPGLIDILRAAAGAHGHGTRNPRMQHGSEQMAPQAGLYPQLRAISPELLRAASY